MTAILIALAFAALTALTALGFMAVIHHINWYAVTFIFLVTFVVDLFALALCKAASRQNPE
jgi:hypothetical protein